MNCSNTVAISGNSLCQDVLYAGPGDGPEAEAHYHMQFSTLTCVSKLVLINIPEWFFFKDFIYLNLNSQFETSWKTTDLNEVLVVYFYGKVII